MTYLSPVFLFLLEINICSPVMNVVTFFSIQASFSAEEIVFLMGVFLKK